MRLLLDTHPLLWFFEGDAALSAVARTAMENRSNDCFVSHATAWEVAIKMSLGKLKLQVPYEDLFAEGLRANAFRILPPELRHYQALLQLPFHHRDPFDCMLIAQAQTESFTLITCDADMAKYGVPLLW